MSIAENIKRLRESHGMNQTEFGKIAGVTDKAVSTWENGTKVPRMGAVQKLADYFNIKKSDILDDEKKPSLAPPDEKDKRLKELSEEVKQLQGTINTMAKYCSDINDLLSSVPIGPVQHLEIDDNMDPIELLINMEQVFEKLSKYLGTDFRLSSAEEQHIFLQKYCSLAQKYPEMFKMFPPIASSPYNNPTNDNNSDSMK